ncbi:MAG: hypothetical protein LBQ09_00195 [Acidobacteriaceae bacterium]|jgi:hypothetical protein|nr:hypothetical protein [Acidobacteriaceae bacterium]
MRTLIGSFVLALAVLVSGCGENIDLTKNLTVTDVATGWFDAGIVDGQNKLVPTISFKLKNNSTQTLQALQANIVFRRVGEDMEWGSSFVRAAGGEGLPAGATSDTLTASSPKGYTGTEARLEMLQNSQFVDARIEVLARYGSAQWQKVGEFVAERRLVER